MSTSLCLVCQSEESVFRNAGIMEYGKMCPLPSLCKKNICKKAITFFSNEIKINPYICNGCQKCIEECPARALQAEGEEEATQDMDIYQDKVFYEESGGGITLSGGEMLYQPDFALQLSCKEKKDCIPAAKRQDF